MKLIDFENVKKICNTFDFLNYLDWIDDALIQKADFVMPEKIRINQANNNYFAVMPCMYEKEDCVIVKMIGRHDLKENENRPVMMSDMLVYEADTGILKAVLDGEYITTLRTGASAAHSALLYGQENTSVIGCIGLGNIMTVCLEIFLKKNIDRKLTIKLHKYHNHENRIIQRFSNYENITFIICESYEETIIGSDIIFSAVTKVDKNFSDDNSFKRGCTVIPIMTRGFQNCDLFFDKVFTDEINQIKGFKYFNEFNSLANTTDVLLGLKKGRENNQERILVYNYGLAIHDLYFALKILNASNNLAEVKYNYCKDKYFV